MIVLNKNKLKNYLNQTKALEDSLKFIYEKDKNNMWSFGSYKTFMRKYNTLAKFVAKELTDVSSLDYFDTENIKSSARFNPLNMENMFVKLTHS
jgi:hypothetical protein